jgi:hypothetical protein
VKGAQYLEIVGDKTADDKIAFKHFEKQFPARATAWNPPALQRGEIFPDTLTEELFDISFIRSYLNQPLFSDNVQRGIADSFDLDGQWLDVKFAECDYKLLNLTNVLDSLDIEGSKISYSKSDGKIITVNAYDFKLGVIKGQWLFRDSAVPNSGVFCTDQFVELVQKNAWSGFRFVPIWDSEHDVFPGDVFNVNSKYIAQHPELYGPDGFIEGEETKWPDEWRIRPDGSVVETESLINELGMKPDDKITVLQGCKGAYGVISNHWLSDMKHPELIKLLWISKQLAGNKSRSINLATAVKWNRHVRDYLELGEHMAGMEDKVFTRLPLSDEHTLTVLEGFNTLIAYAEDWNADIESPEMQRFFDKLKLGLAPGTDEPIQSSYIWRRWIYSLEAARDDDSTARFEFPGMTLVEEQVQSASQS